MDGIRKVSEPQIYGAVGFFTDLTCEASARLRFGGFGYMGKDGLPTCGLETTIELDDVDADTSYLLEIDLWPFFARERGAQPLEVFANGSLIGRSQVAARGFLGYEVPQEALRVGRTLHLRLVHPLAARPCDVEASSTDTRLLSVSLQSILLRPIPAAVTFRPITAPFDPRVPTAQFESIGDNCEFGLFQRRVGDERLGLFRFAGVHIHDLVCALRVQLSGIEKLSESDLTIDDDDDSGEIRVRGGRYGLRYHTGFTLSDVGPTWRSPDGKLLHKLVTKLSFEKRKFLEDLSETHYIFVFRSHEVTDLAQILPLFHALQAYGPNRLLWITAATGNQRAAVVEELRPGLLVGRKTRLGGENDDDDPLDNEWAALCRAAFSHFSRTS